MNLRILYECPFLRISVIECGAVLCSTNLHLNFMETLKIVGYYYERESKIICALNCGFFFQ